MSYDYEAWRVAWRALDRIGKSHLLDDDEVPQMSASGGVNPGALNAPPDRPAAPAMEAGQRQLAYVLARMSELAARAERRLKEGEDPQYVVAEIVGDTRELVARQRRQIPQEARRAARETIAAERGFVSGPM